MPEKYSKETEELFNEIKKLFNLKKTEFIFDPNIEDNYSKDSHDKTTIYYLKDPIMAVYEGVHAYFKERNKRLWEELGHIKYLSKRENIETDCRLEEVTARFIEINFQNITMDTCPDDVQKYVKLISELARWYEDIELGRKIVRLYMSIYKNNCICPKDVQFYNTIKNDIDPIIVYNKLAKYVGTHELI